MTGTTLFTVSRLISKWGDLGLVLPLREAVLLLNPEGLDVVSCMDQQLPDRSIASTAHGGPGDLSRAFKIKKPEMGKAPATGSLHPAQPCTIARCC